ncbi:MAG: S-layer homology domain-containing protein [Clostridiales bacterium]|nr:S-layer homology domain-containing protein [Clostridiales bacterium]
MNKLKKAVAMIMTLVMTLGVMSFTTLAETTYDVDGSTYDTVTAVLNALAAASETSATITLQKNTTEDITITSGMDITLNLNGYTITNSSGDTITVELGATLTIEDSDGNGTVDNVTHQKAAIYNNGTVIINGGTFNRSKENGSDNTYYTVLNHGTMTINGGTFMQGDENSQYSSMMENGYYNYSSSDARSGYVSGTNQEYPTLTINGGTFSGGLNTIKNDDNGILVITDGTFENYAQACVLNWNEATISGGTFTSDEADCVIYTGSYGSDTADKGITTITGGTFSGTSIFGEMNAYYSEDVSVTISGGTFEYTDEFYTLTNGTVSISGGSYSTSVAEYVVDGLNYEACNDGTYTYHETLEAAVDAAGDDGEVMTVAAAAADEAYTIKFDANGGTISSTGESSYTFSAATGDVIYVDEFLAVSRSGYTFNYWLLGSTKYYENGSYTVGTEDVTFTAQWTKKSSGGSSYSLSETTGSSSSSDEEEEETTISTTDTTSSVFTDLSTSHVYYDAIMTAYENGWMVGVSDDTFAADGYLTRAMAAKILHNVAGNPEPNDVAPFLDVVSGEWYSDAIAWAYEQGIIIGYDYINFGPNDYVTTEQFSIMLAIYNGETVPDYVGGAPYATRGWVAYMITA